MAPICAAAVTNGPNLVLPAGDIHVYAAREMAEKRVSPPMLPPLGTANGFEARCGMCVPRLAAAYGGQLLPVVRIRVPYVWCGTHAGFIGRVPREMQAKKTRRESEFFSMSFIRHPR